MRTSKHLKQFCFKKGGTPWNKGKHHTEETKRKMREARLKNPIDYWSGKQLSKEHKEKIRLFLIGKPSSFKGKHHTEASRLKMSLSLKGEKHPNWKGGITPLNHRIRECLEMKSWRLSVFTRDKFTCQECGKHGVALNAHHIKPFARHPELRFDVNNGKTLCEPCHDKTKLGKKT